MLTLASVTAEAGPKAVDPVPVISPADHVKAPATPRLPLPVNSPPARVPFVNDVVPLNVAVAPPCVKFDTKVVPLTTSVPPVNKSVSALFRL